MLSFCCDSIRTKKILASVAVRSFRDCCAGEIEASCSPSGFPRYFAVGACRPCLDARRRLCGARYFFDHGVGEKFAREQAETLSKAALIRATAADRRLRRRYKTRFVCRPRGARNASRAHAPGRAIQNPKEPGQLSVRRGASRSIQASLRAFARFS